MTTLQEKIQLTALQDSTTSVLQDSTTLIAFKSFELLLQDYLSILESASTQEPLSQDSVSDRPEQLVAAPIANNNHQYLRASMLEQTDYKALKNAIRRLEERGIHNANVSTKERKIILYGEEIILSENAFAQFQQLSNTSLNLLKHLRKELEKDTIGNHSNSELFAALLSRITEFVKSCWSWLRRQSIIANTFPTVEMSETINFINYNKDINSIEDLRRFDRCSITSNHTNRQQNQALQKQIDFDVDEEEEEISSQPLANHVAFVQSSQGSSLGRE